MSSRSQNRFNQREVARALRAARLAGERPERVEIDPATGRVTVIIAKAGEGAAGAVWGLRSLRGPIPLDPSQPRAHVQGDRWSFLGPALKHHRRLARLLLEPPVTRAQGAETRLHSGSA
jgi:hypothetical protein